MKPHQNQTKSLLLLIGILLISISAFAQDPFNKDKNYSFQPVVSAEVLEKDAIDISIINSLNSFWLAYREFNDGFTASRISDRARYTTLDHLIRVSYGFDQNGRWDLGAELRYTHLRLDNAARNSPFKVLGNDETTGTSYHGLSYLGLRARVMPFADVAGLTLQATAAFPTAKSAEQRRNLNAQRPQASLGATYLGSFSERTKYFLQTEWRTFISNDELGSTHHLPSLSGFLIFDAYDSKLFVFPGLSYAMTLNNSLNQTNEQLYGSLGIQIQSSYNLAFSLNAQTPFLFESGSAFTEWVSESYSGVSLGIRIIL